MKETFQKAQGKVPSCPFCGGKNLTSAGWLTAFDEFVYFVTCDRCHARGPECRVEKESILTWNMRYVSSFNATIEGAENGELVTPKTGDLKP